MRNCFLIFILFLLSIPEYSCNRGKLSFDLESVVGEYSSDNKFCKEILVLKKDSTYSYYQKNKIGAEYYCDGKWELIENLDPGTKDWSSKDAKFYNWRIGVDPSREDFRSPQDKINKNATGIYWMPFITDDVGSKRVHALLRDIDDWQFNFIRVDDLK